MKIAYLDPAAVRAMLDDQAELALIDVREELPFSELHLLHARAVSLSRLELRIGALVPRLNTRIVICDGGDGLSERAAAVLAGMGYSDLSILDGGTSAWQAAGYVLFSGVNVPSKAFGEFIEHASHTPSVSAQELHEMLKNGADIVVLDSRPFDEYSRVSIPSATNVPGAELVLRVKDAAPSSATTVVVNCAGRTRSIIGAQSLIDAGVPNKVVALRNGTMGWSLAGYLCDSGRSKQAPRPSAAALSWSREAAAQMAKRFAIERVDLDTVRRWQNDPVRTTYLLDVRDPQEYASGHVAGARSAPGGQLVQATDHYVGTLNARLVLVDDLEVRAVMTASWLKRMGWREVYILIARGDIKGNEKSAPPAIALPSAGALEPYALAERLAQSSVTVIDLSLSRDYRKGHIPGAWFALRSRLGAALQRIPLQGDLVLTSEDGVLAALAVGDATALTERPVLYLAGGNAAWQKSGRSLESGDDRMADDPLDVWLKPYERSVAIKAAMADYLSWEVDLLPRIAADGTCRFSNMP